MLVVAEFDMCRSVCMRFIFNSSYSFSFLSLALAFVLLAFIAFLLFHSFIYNNNSNILTPFVFFSVYLKFFARPH